MGVLDSIGDALATIAATLGQPCEVTEAFAWQGRAYLRSVTLVSLNGIKARLDAGGLAVSEFSSDESDGAITAWFTVSGRARLVGTYRMDVQSAVLAWCGARPR
ncbi:MAG TPA: hypothetical protein VNT60_07840 [Deinococcales bacterium]|nr:hypothetical protein [Deinococcales bacterium]